MTAIPRPDAGRRDVRMDGVYFCRLTATPPFVKALAPGNYSYCVMVRAGRLRLETDFPANLQVDLAAGDAVAISGLAPHVLRSPDASPAAPTVRFEQLPLPANTPAAEVEIVLGVAPNEALALGSLTLGPVIVRPGEHPDLSRRLWSAVEMLEDEYATGSWIDSNLVIRRLAEIMAINIVRRSLADHHEPGHPGAPTSGYVTQAITAFLRTPDRPWTLAELARAAGMSRTRFAREFKLVTGETPGRIVTRMRLTSVARQLATGPISVEAAAEQAGYSSSAAFVRAFQREFGETPARWRRHYPSDEAAARLRPAARRSPRRASPTMTRHERDAS